MESLGIPRYLVATCELVLMSLLLGSIAQGAEPNQPDVLTQPAAERLFALRVLPLLKVKCFGCHGQDSKDIRGDYSLLTREGMLQGGESEEPTLVPGKPEDSSLYQAVLWNGYEMPPKENDRLTSTETEYIRQWIAAGVPWPNAQRQVEIQKEEWAIPVNADGVILSTSGGLADDWTYCRYQLEDIWAFQAVTKRHGRKIPNKLGAS